MRSQKASPGARRRVVGEVLVHGLSHDGRGLARVKGKTLFVEGGLPGEQVSVLLTEDRRRYASGRVNTIESASSERVEPPCRHFKTCGGCSLQYWSHEGQLQGKQSIVLDQLQRFSSLQPAEVSEPLVSHPYGYRYRCRLSIIWKKGRLSLGFREKQSKNIVDIKECPVLAEPLQPLPEKLRALLSELKQREAVSHAELFLADSGRAILLRHIRDLPPADLNKLEVFAREEQLHLYLKGDEQHVGCLYAPVDDPWMYYRIPELDLKFQFRPADFTQVNWSVNCAMVLQALDWLDLKPEEKVLDLFCGLGNFSLALARKAASVVGVEGSAGAVERASFNADLNGLKNCRFYQADLAALVGGKQAEGWLTENYDAMLLDPPRTGAIEIIEQMADYLPDRLLYVSCNPATLARDAGALAKLGFSLERLGVMDMFPQTGHVESMALFKKHT
ncbi:23S rRNA (uracil(1939)-C(5))-methyltransferase RlmD [Endozoicomonas arenosclerae]|uniref:23S rRNA (uracil(1939)-C(5))-methyltransferase RlmD n=1 Tax=Endozoicomonas arenosclerae TaxID=1633495 RepID=UPI0007855BD2|nr:23S rRNA (uracil(1939)-C(5))-methyltransferase RlmD [Endozoicomonas arenosclerae]